MAAAAGAGRGDGKNAVYALPASGETREDFAWLAKEIVESGGEAIVCEAGLVEGLSDDELQALFDAARDEDYARIAGEARELARGCGRAPTTRWPRSPARRPGCASSSTRWSPSISSAPKGAQPAQGLVSGLEAALKQEGEAMTDSKRTRQRRPARSRTTSG